MGEVRTRKEGSVDTEYDDQPSLESSIHTCKMQLSKLEKTMLDMTDEIITNNGLSPQERLDINDRISSMKSIYKQLVELEYTLMSRRDNLALSRSLNAIPEIAFKMEETSQLEHIANEPIKQLPDNSIKQSSPKRTAETDNKRKQMESPVNTPPPSENTPGEITRVTYKSYVPKYPSDPRLSHLSQTDTLSKTLINQKNNTQNDSRNTSYSATNGISKPISELPTQNMRSSSNHGQSKDMNEKSLKRRAQESSVPQSDISRKKTYPPQPRQQNNQHKSSDTMETKQTKTISRSSSDRQRVSEDTIRITVKNAYNVALNDRNFSLKPNDTVNLLNVYNDGWCIAESATGTRALAPHNLLQPVHGDNNEGKSKAYAIANYTGRHKHESSFKINDVFYIVNRLKSQWYLIEKDGQIHLVPGQYFYQP